MSSEVTIDKDEFNLRSSIKSEDFLKTIKKGPLVEFYRGQNDLIETLLTKSETEVHAPETSKLEYKIGMYGSFLANMMLFGCQLTAAILSGSLVFFATTADAFMDLTSSSVLLYAGILASRRDYYNRYPSGKEKYKTAGIIVFATLMCTLALQLMVESAKSIFDGQKTLNIDLFTYIIIGVAFVTKLLLLIYCKSNSHLPALKVLAQDHQNDVIFNSTGIILAIVASKSYWWLDPLGAILIALLIIRSWFLTAREHILLIVGKAADPAFLNRIVYIAMTHDPRIEKIDTVRGYHSGDNVFVEVDVTFPPDMTLKEAHDIGESLQNRIESLPEVDRAFVHLDYETTHKPEHNIKQRYH